MKKANFLRLLELMSNIDRDIVVLEGLGVDLQDCACVKGVYEIFNLVVENAYGKDGLDWVLWYVYEKQPNPALQAFDEDGNEIIKTKDELHAYLEANHKAK